MVSKFHLLSIFYINKNWTVCLFVCLNALISWTTGSNWKNIVVSDSPFIEEGYITSRYGQYEPSRGLNRCRKLVSYNSDRQVTSVCTVTFTSSILRTIQLFKGALDKSISKGNVDTALDCWQFNISEKLELILV